MMRGFAAIFAMVGLAGCALAPVQAPGPSGAAGLATPQTAAENFIAVVDRMEPIAERICRAEAPRAKCDYQIVVDSRPDLPPNAFQTLDPNGRPIIAFTVSLIADARNQDELAFILGHEAAHHIAGHIPKAQTTAQAGALLGGLLATLGGAAEPAIRDAAEIGATLGARVYSKEFELEADALGAVIAHRAGYDPIRGAEYFNRIADPGNQFLGTHPANADRIRTVREAVAALR